MLSITSSQQSRVIDQSYVTELIQEALSCFPNLEGDLFLEKSLKGLQAKEGAASQEIFNSIVLHALDEIDASNPDWTYIAAAIYLENLYVQAAENRGFHAKDKYGSLNDLLQTLTEKGIYNEKLLGSYSREEILELDKAIDSKKDQLFTYIGIRTLADRYLARSHDGAVYELPQERFMIIAMTLMLEEQKENRLELVKEAYWALSNLYMTVATPTLSNAGKSYGQLSSCFIDTVDDSLRGIYDSNTDIATLSKNGGGIN
jgi:ribonucleoside-diphosphate reductase alpha chain